MIVNVVHSVNIRQICIWICIRKEDTMSTIKSVKRKKIKQNRACLLIYFVRVGSLHLCELCLRLYALMDITRSLKLLQCINSLIIHHQLQQMTAIIVNICSQKEAGIIANAFGIVTFVFITAATIDWETSQSENCNVYQIRRSRIYHLGFLGGR